MSIDPTELAEAYAGKLSTQRSPFEHLSPGDRGILIVLLQKLDAQDRRIRELEHRTKGGRPAE